jgi:molybdopterin-containing oxidoreductase family membrane subunit
METLKLFGNFVTGSVAVVLRGSRSYYAWIFLLVCLITAGLLAYANQWTHGLAVTHMRDPVSWGFYIGNFAFLVGVAAAAVVLVIPAYVYNWGPIKEVVLIGELLSVAAIIMCMLFVTVDVGRADRLWHLFPIVGLPNFPHSMLMWDILVLNGYFLINLFIVTYLIFKRYTGQAHSAAFIMPIIFLSIPFAIGIHTVTAFLFMALKSRPFWHTAVLAPRFLSSAFCSGPALLLLIFQVLRRVGKLKMSDAALFKIGELLAYAMAVNLFFLGVEVFTEFYGETAHSIHARFQWLGVHGQGDIRVWSWLALAFNLTAFAIFVAPALRNRLALLNGACLLAIGGVFIEKGMGLVLPGLTPDALGELYTYTPSLNEVLVSVGVWGIGALLFTFMVRIALAVDVGDMRYEGEPWRGIGTRTVATLCVLAGFAGATVPMRADAVVQGPAVAFRAEHMILDAAIRGFQILVGTQSGRVAVFDWRNGRIGAPLLVLEPGEGQAYPASVSSVATSPSGARCAVVSSDGVLRVFEFGPDGDASLSLVRRVHGLRIASFLEEKRLLLGDLRGELALLDLEGGAELYRRQLEYDPIYRVTPGPKGERAALAFRSSAIQIVDARSGETTAVLRGHRDSVYALAWIGMDALVSGGKDKRLFAWDLPPSSSGPRELYRGDHYITAVGADLAHRRVALSLDDHRVGILRLADGQITHRLDGHTAPLQVLAFVDAGRQLISVGNDARVLVWRLDADGTGGRI